MDDMRDLFQEVILDHYRKPRNFGALDDANRFSHGKNPLCGDDIKVYLRVSDDDTIDDARFEGEGCAICTASASLMTESVIGRPVAEVDALFESFHDLTTRGKADGDLGKLKVFSGVARYPVRVKCATLPWHTLHAAVHQLDEPVTTE